MNENTVVPLHADSPRVFSIMSKSLFEATNPVSAVSARNELFRAMQAAGLYTQLGHSPQSNPYANYRIVTMWMKDGTKAHAVLDPQRVADVIAATPGWSLVPAAEAHLMLPFVLYRRSPDVECSFSMEPREVVHLKITGPKKAKPTTIPYYD